FRSAARGFGQGGVVGAGQYRVTGVAEQVDVSQRIRRAAAVGFAEQVRLTRADDGGCGGFGCRGRRVGRGRFGRRRAAGREGQAEGEGERKRPEEGLFHRDNRLSGSWINTREVKYVFSEHRIL